MHNTRKRRSQWHDCFWTNRQDAIARVVFFIKSCGGVACIDEYKPIHIHLTRALGWARDAGKVKMSGTKKRRIWTLAD